MFHHGFFSMTSSFISPTCKACPQKKEIEDALNLVAKYQKKFKSWCEDIDLDTVDGSVTLFYHKDKTFDSKDKTFADKDETFTVSKQFFQDFERWRIVFKVAPSEWW